MVLSLFPIHNFPSESFALIFTIIFVFIILVESRVLLRNREKKEDKSSLKFILIGIFLPLSIMIILSFFRVGQLPLIFGYFGLIILLNGFIIRQYSIFILGKFFGPVVMKQKDQILIKNGPYRYIRHPSYTGLFLELIGVSFSLSNWISSLLVIVFFVPVIINRIRIEEKFMISNFKEYNHYQKETWKLIPFVY